MKFSLETIIFAILLIDSLAVNLFAWFGGYDKWYPRTFSRLFPIAKGWAGYYLLLVIFIGYLLNKFGMF